MFSFEGDKYKTRIFHFFSFFFFLFFFSGLVVEWQEHQAKLNGVSKIMSDQK